MPDHFLEIQVFLVDCFIMPHPVYYITAWWPCLCVWQEKEDDFVTALNKYKQALDLLMSLLQGVCLSVCLSTYLVLIDMSRYFS